MPDIANSSLKEIIFEIRYKDPAIINYDIFIGELHAALKDAYPFVQPLKPKEIPALLMPFVMQHRFRKAEEKYPLYQLGPGVTSFNIDGLTYSELPDDHWASFKNELTTFLQVYEEKLPEGIESRDLENISLRAIFEIEDTSMYPAMKDYFTNKLKLNIDLNFAEDISFIPDLEDTRLTQRYKIDRNSFFQYELRTITDGARKLLIDITVKASDSPALTGIDDWLETSYTNISNFFEAITREIHNVVE